MKLHGIPMKRGGSPPFQNFFWVPSLATAIWRILAFFSGSGWIIMGFKRGGFADAAVGAGGAF